MSLGRFNEEEIGRAHCGEPHLFTTTLMTALRELIPLAPDHLPHELKFIQAVGRAYPDLTRIACFDTAFHRNVPKVARIYLFAAAFAGIWNSWASV